MTRAHVGRITAAATLLALALAGCGDDTGGEPPMDQARMLRVEIRNVSTPHAFVASGVFNTPVGHSDPGPIGPGDAYEVTFSAPRGAALSFASMFGQSNDFFYAPDEHGIALYAEDGTPTSGDVTSLVSLWDAATEENEEPGLGPNQAPRQAGPNTGAPDPVAEVRLADDDFGNLPAVADVLKVTLTPHGESRFMLRLENVSTADILMTSDGMSHPAPVAPGVWVVHTTDAPLFQPGQTNRGDGLEQLAEDGDPSALAARLAEQTGLTSLLSPGVWAVHRDGAPLFDEGQAYSGASLERLAEDGNPAPLADSVAAESAVSSSGTFTIPDGASAPSPAGPGQSYTFTIAARPGDRLSFVSMFAQSNDLFYAPGPEGFALFDADGAPITDATAQLRLWDAGTEVNQEPGIGQDQAPRQAGPDTGMAEDGVLRGVSDGFTYPAPSQVIQVTVTPQ